MGIGLEGVAIILFLGLAAAFALYWVSLRLVAGFWPSFWRSLGALCAAMLVSQVIVILLGGLMQLGFGRRLESSGAQWAIGLLFVAIQLWVLAGATHWLVRRPDGAMLPMGRSLSVAALFFALCFALGVAVAWWLLGEMPLLSP